jgi:hypothetical protein
MQFAALEGQQKELAAALEDPATYTPASLPPRLYLPARFRELLRAQLPERPRCGTHAARWRAFGQRVESAGAFKLETDSLSVGVVGAFACDQTDSVADTQILPPTRARRRLAHVDPGPAEFPSRAQ